MHKHTFLMRNNEAERGLIIVPAPKTPVSSVMSIIIICFILLLFCPSQLKAQLGTTPNIKHIVVGRCYNYVTLVNPGLRHDCEEIWRQFEGAVVCQSSCNVTVEDYHPMFYAMPQTWPCDKFLFWSKTRTLMHSYAAVMRHFWTLEDTLVGYMFNDLIWCGQEDTGFDFDSCPEWLACRNHPVYSLWRQASQNFAEMACGNITVLLNGSIVNAFNRLSMFGSVELDSLNPLKVNYARIVNCRGLCGSAWNRLKKLFNLLARSTVPTVSWLLDL
uniref:ADP-ribosyl cyclase/cyclic ADP-ribose hydrolase n=1 Tax=Anabas testudineus TaxID=64144 RepID=A0A3Q1JLX1_ANATE